MTIKKIATRLLLAVLAATSLATAAARAAENDAPLAANTMDFGSAPNHLEKSTALLPLGSTGGSASWIPQERRTAACTGSFSVGVQKGYFYKYYAIDVADGHTTSQGAVSGTCGDFTLEAGGSVLLASSGGHDSRRLANEWWLTAAYHPDVETRLGTFRFEFAASYRGLDHGQGPFAVRDDSTELLGSIGYPISVGSVEVTPCLRVIKSNPVGYNNSLYWTGECLTIAGPLPGENRFRLEVFDLHNVNSATAVIHRNVTYGSFEGSATLPGSAWTLTAGLWVSRYGMQDTRFDFQLADRDGRMRRVLRANEPSNKLAANPYFRLTRPF